LELSYAGGGRRLAVGRAHDTKVLQVNPARELFTLRSHGGAVALSQDGRWVAMADGRRLVLYDTQARKRHSLPPEHTEAIQIVAISPNGRSVATIGKDGSVKVWDIAALVDGLAAAFNGRDLTGWKSFDTPPDTFVVENGLLVATGKAKGWLLTDAEYTDFELRLDYRLQPAANGGIAVHALPQAVASYGMEIQLIDDDHYQATIPGSFRPEMRTGAIFDVQAPSVLNNNKVGEWNSIRLLVEGRHVLVEINDLRVVDRELDSKDVARHPELARRAGRIGLQSLEGRVEFRNLLLKRLSPADKK
jgi:hypothetical protein